MPFYLLKEILILFTSFFFFSWYLFLWYFSLYLRIFLVPLVLILYFFFLDFPCTLLLDVLFLSWVFLVPCSFIFFLLSGLSWYLYCLYTSCISRLFWYLSFWYVIFYNQFSTYFFFIMFQVFFFIPIALFNSLSFFLNYISSF